jgi:acyl-CoA thioester hydrolase
MYVFERTVHFYETDLMGLVHHSNYLRFYEEARVGWLRDRGLHQYHGKDADCLFAVYETQVWHHAPAYFEDRLRIELQVRLQRIRIIYEYKMFSPRFTTPISTARTVHVPVDNQTRLIRLPQGMQKVMEKEQWIETWL